jgi:hypothetical protein
LGLKKYIEAENLRIIFNGQLPTGAGGDFDNRYSQRGVQWAVKQVAKAAGIIKEVHTHTLRHSYATHLLEDGMDIMTLKDLWDIKMLRLQWNTSILPNSRVNVFLVHSIRFCTMQSVADVLRKVGSKIESYGLNTLQLRTLYAIKKRTAELGGHIDACDDCGNITP